jgi:tetratricopeptide (TPR) repeat protein
MTRQQSEADSQRIEGLIGTLYNEAPGHPVVLSLVAERFLRIEKLDSARHYFKLSLAKDPLSLPIWEEVMRLDSRLGLNDSLYADAEKALTVFPNHLAFNYYMGVACVQLNRYEDAIRPLEKVVRLGGTDYELQAQAHTMLGDVYAHKNDPTKAEEHYKKAVALAPGNLTALNNYAYLLANHNRNLQEALRMIEKVIDREPNNAAFQDTYGWVLFKLERYEDARRWVEKSLAAHESADVAEHLGDIHFKLGNVDKAVEYWNKARNLGSSSTTLSAKIANRSL